MSAKKKTNHSSPVTFEAKVLAIEAIQDGADRQGDGKSYYESSMLRFGTIMPGPAHAHVVHMAGAARTYVMPFTCQAPKTPWGGDIL